MNNLVAKTENDVPSVMSKLTDFEKKKRLKELYSMDEILEIVGYYDNSLEDGECEKIESLEATPDKWKT